MLAFIFKCTTRPTLQVAATDAQGSRLPACPDGRWAMAGELDLDGVARGLRRPIDTTAVKDSLNRHGYHVFGGSGCMQ